MVTIESHTDCTYGSSHSVATWAFCHRCADAYLTANREMPLIAMVPCAVPIGVETSGPHKSLLEE
jgi:hypothetical protein